MSKCPLCGSEGKEFFTTFLCTNLNCKNHDKDVAREIKLEKRNKSIKGKIKKSKNNVNWGDYDVVRDQGWGWINHYPEIEDMYFPFGEDNKD